MSRRRILITGVSRRAGIGFALAEQLSAEADIVVSGWAAHDAEQPWGADEEQPALPRYLAMDLADPDAPRRLIRAARDELGGLDVLLVVHARSSSQSLPELTATELDLSFAVNARATLLLIKQFAVGFDGTDGRVITFSSGQHREPMPAELPYIASKAAVQQLTASLAVELAPRGITVNCVNPGPVDTGYADEAARAAVAARHPRGRWGRPQDVVAVVRWLISPGAAWLTGQTIDADGGWQLRQR